MTLHLDIVIPTFNRRPLLERTLESLLRATPPSAMTWRVTVADNRSSDNTRALVEDFAKRHPQHVRYCFAPIQGRSAAINTGISDGDGELVGLLDDDEEIREQWLTVVEREFRDRALDYIGGPCLPNFEVPPPSWIDTGFPAVIGHVTGPSARTPYGPDFPGILMGGNAVIRRQVLHRVGGLRTDLGRSGGTRLMSGEDRALYHMLVKSGARGLWVPDLEIDHFVPASRMSKAYHRRWAFDHAMSMAILERGEVGSTFRIPRWRYGVLLRTIVPATVSPDETRRLRAQLQFLDALGFLFGAQQRVRGSAGDG
jgi:glycosyltransferase involved in cell wall biosynthesis